MARAAPGEILISRRVQRIVGVQFTLEPLLPVRLKGLPEPVPVFRVVGELGRVPRLAEPAYTLPMIGRARACADRRAARPGAARARPGDRHHW